MKHLSSVNKYLWRYKHILALGLVFTAFSNYLGSLAPEVVSQAIDFATNKQPVKFAGYIQSSNNVKNGILIASLLILTLSILSGFFLFLMRKTIIVTSHKIVEDIRSDLYNHYQKLDQLFYKKNATGDMMSRLTEDISNVRMYVGPSLMYFANTIAMFCFYVYRMLKADATLTLWTLLPLPFLSISIYIVSSIIFKKTNIIQTKLSGLTTFTQEAYSGIRVIKAYARESGFSKDFKQQNKEFKEESLSLAKVEAFFFPLMMLLIGASTIIAIYVGGQHIEQGKIEAGTIVQFIIYVGSLTWPVASLGWIASNVQKASASQARINEILDVEPNIIDANGAVSISEPIQKIEFKNVSFTYLDTGIEALKNISFTIKKGEKVAIIGKTGSGKTTLSDLILRVYQQSQGTILLNDTPIEHIKLNDIRKKIGYVPQDVFLFSDTIANNIQLAYPNATLEQIQQSAKAAAVSKDIERFPQQYETLVGERGVMLSGGQKQRISIARALLHNPMSIILDDALSAVDAETEQEILTQFDSVLAGKTVLIITHRVFTLFDVDKIIVLDEGKIAQIGTHEQLIAQEGIYKEIHELSSS